MQPQNLLKMVRLLFCFLGSWFRSQNNLALENVALRQQLANFKQRQPRPALADADRAFWVLLRTIWSKWSDALIIVTPETVVRWHCKGFRLYWDALSRKGRKSGRAQIDRQIRKLIVQMASENSTWRAPRIHGELLMLGYDVSERTVSRYLPKRPPDQDKIRQWKTFLENHRHAIASMDLFTIPLATFRVLYALVIIDHGRRVLLYCNVSFNPTALWVVQQLREAFPFDTAPRYLIFDRDSTFSTHVIATIKSFGTKPVRTSWKSPWQNGVVERWIGSCRRELLDHIIVFNERHATRLLSEYIGYYNADRCHYGLGKDAPESRTVQHRPSNQARVVAMARVGGLHHRYEWQHAA